MNKLNETEAIESPENEKVNEKLEGNGSGCEEAKEKEEDNGGAEGEEKKGNKMEGEEKNVLKFTMLFNKYNGFLDLKRRSDEDKRDNKYFMFFNKEVTIRRIPEGPSVAAKILEAKKSGFFNLRRNPPLQGSRSKSKFPLSSFPSQEPQISEPGMMFCTSLFSSHPDVCERKAQPKSETGKKFFISSRNPRMETEALEQLSGRSAAAPKDLRNHNSLTSLPKSSRTTLRGALRAKIPSLTALDSNSSQPKSGQARFGYWDHWDDLTLMQSDVEKRLNLQISRSTNDSSRRCMLKFKKEDPGSVSDSKLLYTDSEYKKHIKKCDKKSRGDSSRKERSYGNRKQVQWKSEVDVIYFSTHLAANGDRTEEIVGRVMEPLREEWEQQRKGFYAKLVPSHMETHEKDRFISLLKI